MTLIIITGGIDLSVGSIVGFTAYYVGQTLADNNDMSAVLAVLLAIGIGAVVVPLLARALGVQDYGSFVTALAASQIFFAALALLLSDSPDTALPLARRLQQLNTARQHIEKGIGPRA